jgi:FtsH-binding integral membrane protein
MSRVAKVYVFLGLPLLVAAIVLIALSADPRDPNPTGTLLPIFGAVAAYMAVLFVIQRRDVSAARKASAPPPEWIGRRVDDPTRVSPGELWAAMAVAPIDDDAADAQEHAWELAENSINTGAIVTLLIFIAVPLMYVTGSVVPVLVGAPIIVAVALIKGLGPGGISAAYDSAARAMEPLGFQQTERPEIGAAPRLGPPGGLKTDIRGGLEYEGSRHGRRVRVRWDDGACEITVVADAPEFEARSGDGRIHNRTEALPPVSPRRWGRCRGRRTGRTSA